MNQRNQIASSRWTNSRNLLIIHTLFVAICGSFIFVSIFKTFAERKSLFETNLSVEKKIFLLMVLLLVLFFYLTSLYFLLRPNQAQRVGIAFFDKLGSSTGLRVSGVGFALCWIGFFIPPYLMFDGIQGYFLLIKPIFLWGCLFFISQITVVHLAAGGQLFTSLSPLRNSLYRLSFIVLFLFFGVFILVVNTGIGISVREDYWYGAGVPILWFQIALSLLVGIIFSWILKSVQFVKRIPRIDAIIFLLLWLVAAYFWGKEPLQSSHFMPDTGANQIFPYSDAATFDVGSQYALIGQELFNGQYFDRSLYSALLTYFHILAGQNTEYLMVVQAVVFGVFPAILYLLGKELHGRTLGVVLATIILFRGINAIYGSSMIDSAGPKMMLTDFPTAIGISLIILFILKWINDPQKILNMIWAGCSIGLTLLLRTHVILLLPFIALFIIFLFRNRKIFWIYGVVLLILGMLVSTLPLDIQNQKKGIPIFYMYYSRIQLVLKERYGVSDDSSSRIFEKPKTSLLAGRERLQVYRDNERVPCDSKYCAVANHFFHNLITSVLSLPASFVLDDFRHTVKGMTPYWQQSWVGGNSSIENYVLLLVNLALIAIGIGTTWERLKYRALFPLMIYFVYMLSNSLALTSGGRYITPVDWILYIYYLIGTLIFCLWFFRLIGFDFLVAHEKLDLVEPFVSTPVISVRNLAGAFVVVFLFGSAVPFAGAFSLQRYYEKTAADVLVVLNERGLLKEANLNQESVSEFLNGPDARLISGRLLYPRFYASDEGEYGLDYPYTALDYRRLAFTVIGSLTPGANGVIFPVENSIPNLHASDVVVLGCEGSHFLDAAVVFILSEPRKTYVRSAELVLQCPLSSP